MSAAQHTPGPMRREVEMDGRRYTVHFGDDGKPITVRVHANSRPGGYCIAFRRLPLDGAKARAAIAKATGSAA